MAKAIRKVTMEVFCFEDEAEWVKESLGDWFDESEASLYSSLLQVTEPTEEEDAAVRPELEKTDDEIG